MTGSNVVNDISRTVSEVFTSFKEVSTYFDNVLALNIAIKRFSKSLLKFFYEKIIGQHTANLSVLRI